MHNIDDGVEKSFPTHFPFSLSLSFCRQSQTLNDDAADDDASLHWRPGKQRKKKKKKKQRNSRRRRRLSFIAFSSVIASSKKTEKLETSLSRSLFASVSLLFFWHNCMCIWCVFGCYRSLVAFTCNILSRHGKSHQWFLSSASPEEEETLQKTSTLLLEVSPDRFLSPLAIDEFAMWRKGNISFFFFFFDSSSYLR